MIYDSYGPHREFSLIKYCAPCRARCCKVDDLIGSPILSIEERDRAESIQAGSTRSVVSPSNHTYYLIKEQEGRNLCRLLTEDNTCIIQRVKPLDCLCYPIKAVYDADHSVKLVIDPSCSALEHLREMFIYVSSEVALQSIRRFDEATYQHWLDNNVGWVKQALDLDEFLRQRNIDKGRNH